VAAPLTPGPLDPFENAGLAVTVTVPVTAAAGAVDVAHLQIASQNPGVPAVTVTLTTTANTVHGLGLDAPVVKQYVLPGGVVSYTLYLTNTGNITDTFDIVITHTWDVGYVPTTGPLAPGESAVLVVTVYALTGGADTAEVVITSRGDAALVREIELLTSVYHRLYLAIVNRD